jgi:hypothetical protein
MTEQQASELVRSYAGAIAAVVGVDAAQTETRLRPSPCENSSGQTADDGRFYVQGNWRMPLAPSDQVATLVRLHDDWTVQGYQIKKFQTFSDTEAVVIAENPVDEVELMVESGVPPIAVAVVIMTPCYRPI